MKKFAKLVALLLAVTMVLSLAACGKSDTKTDDKTDGQTASGAYTLGINTWGSGVPVLDMFGDAKQYTLETLGHKVSRMSDDFTADKELQNVQNMCASGVDGIVFQAAAVTTVPQIGVECAKAKIPFAFDVFVGDDADLEKLAAENEYYCGAIDLDMVADGAAIERMNNGNKVGDLAKGLFGDVVDVTA